MYQFIQSTGEFLHNWQHVTFGYSGAGEGKNNPVMQQIPNVGPIPCGTYRIGPAYDHPELGPLTMNLDPEEGTEDFGRSEFRIHGDSVQHPGQASHGCVILPRGVRQEVADSGDDLLRVVARSIDEVQQLSASD